MDNVIVKERGTAWKLIYLPQRIGGREAGFYWRNAGDPPTYLDAVKDMLMVFVTDAHGKSPRDAAEEFARNYFVSPRKVGAFYPSKGNPNTATFKLIDGTKTYCVILAKGERLVSFDAFQIYRIDAEKEIESGGNP